MGSTLKSRFKKIPEAQSNSLALCAVVENSVRRFRSAVRSEQAGRGMTEQDHAQLGHKILIPDDH
jgi:hypothetical protein